MMLPPLKCFPFNVFVFSIAMEACLTARKHLNWFLVNCGFKTGIDERKTVDAENVHKLLRRDFRKWGNTNNTSLASSVSSVLPKGQIFTLAKKTSSLPSSCMASSHTVLMAVSLAASA